MFGVGVRGGPAAAPPSHAADLAAISVVESTAEPDFPYHITFSLTAESSAEPIEEVMLLYGASRGETMTIAEAEFEPGPRVEARHVLDTQVFYMPPGVDLTYQWMIRDAAGNEQETPPQSLTYHDERFDWNERTAENVTVYWYRGGEAFGDALIETSVQALTNLEQEIGATVEEPVKIYIYATINDMRSAIQPNSVEWVGGEARPGLGLIIGAISPEDVLEIGRLVPHELSHQVLHQATENPYGGVPRWFDEGLAMYNQETMMMGMESMVQEAARAGQLIPLEALASSFPTDPQQALLSYAQSHSVVAYLIETYGTEATENLVEAFKEATPLEEALQTVLNRSVDELDAEWRETLPVATIPTRPTATPQRSAPADRFEGDPVEPEPVVPRQPTIPPPPISSVPTAGPQPTPAPQSPATATGIVFPLWAELALALGCCVTGIALVGVSLLVVLRLAGADKS
jgi:hypothetical protein